MDYKDGLTGTHIDGAIGEAIIREYLKTLKHSFFQADLISTSKEGKLYLWEVKYQERFKAPPFDGHGLPLIQVQSRIKFYKATGIIPCLIVIEKGSQNVFAQSINRLNNLPAHDKFITPKNNRIIFRLSAFKEIIISSEIFEKIMG